jgi:hypothetical protein
VRAQEADAAKAAKLLAKVGALERQLAEEEGEERVALRALSARAKAHAAALDENFAASEKAIKASLKRLKDMAAQYGGTS